MLLMQSFCSLESSVRWHVFAAMPKLSWFSLSVLLQILQLVLIIVSSLFNDLLKSSNIGSMAKSITLERCNVINWQLSLLLLINQ